MPLPATIHDEPRIYSNGAEHLACDFTKWSGTQSGTDLRLDDGFYECEAGFLDAPGLIAAGSMCGDLTPGKSGYAVATSTIRTT